MRHLITVQLFKIWYRNQVITEDCFSHKPFYLFFSSLFVDLPYSVTVSILKCTRMWRWLLNTVFLIQLEFFLRLQEPSWLYFFNGHVVANSIHFEQLNYSPNSYIWLTGLACWAVEVPLECGWRVLQVCPDWIRDCQDSRRIYCLAVMHFSILVCRDLFAMNFQVKNVCVSLRKRVARRTV